MWYRAFRNYWVRAYCHRPICMMYEPLYFSHNRVLNANSGSDMVLEHIK